MNKNTFAAALLSLGLTLAACSPSANQPSAAASDEPVAVATDAGSAAPGGSEAGAIVARISCAGGVTLNVTYGSDKAHVDDGKGGVYDLDQQVMGSGTLYSANGIELTEHQDEVTLVRPGQPVLTCHS